MLGSDCFDAVIKMQENEGKVAALVCDPSSQSGDAERLAWGAPHEDLNLNKDFLGPLGVPAEVTEIGNDAPRWQRGNGHDGGGALAVFLGVLGVRLRHVLRPAGPVVVGEQVARERFNLGKGHGLPAKGGKGHAGGFNA